LSHSHAPTAQKNGITVDGTGSSATVDGNVVTGAGPTSALGENVAQNGIQISDGARAVVGGNRVSDNAYSGAGLAFATGILVFGGAGSPLSTGTAITGNVLTDNDVGIAADNYSPDPMFTGPATTPTDVLIVGNRASSSAVTNTSGFCTTSGCPGIGYQAGIEDIGNRDDILSNAVSGSGYAPQGPSPFVRPIDITSFPTIAPFVFGNTYDGKPYNG
jgi:hypothetical protein